MARIGPLRHTPSVTPTTRPPGPPSAAPDRRAGGWDRKWTDGGAGTHYETDRWTSRARRERDPRLVRALLEGALVRPVGAAPRILDVPCGTGRLVPTLATLGRVTGVDVSRPMLLASGRAGARGRVCADVRQLPFVDDTFDVVVCCRLLHHLRDEAEAGRVLRELVRVSQDLVVVSFWDAGSLAAWRRRVWPGARPPRRVARPRERLATLLEDAGARVLAWRHSLRFVSRQAFVLARKRAPTG